MSSKAKSLQFDCHNYLIFTSFYWSELKNVNDLATDKVIHLLICELESLLAFGVIIFEAFGALRYSLVPIVRPFHSISGISRNIPAVKRMLGRGGYGRSTLAG